MPKILQGYPIPILVDAFRSALASVAGVFLALYLETILVWFVLWEPFDPIIVIHPLIKGASWMFLLAVPYGWIPVLVLSMIILAYIALPHLRFELILAAVATGMTTELLGHLGSPKDFWFLARTASAAALLLGLGIGSWIACPWGFRSRTS